MQESHLGPDDYYKNTYVECYGTGLIGLVYALVRRIMERRYDSRSGLNRIIEVGCGTGQYFNSVKQKYNLYVMTDIDDNLIESINISAPNVNKAQADAENLTNYTDSSFDRLIATCLLAHLNNPLQALSEWRRVIRDNGCIVIYVAPEPGILVRFIRNVFIYPKQKLLGIENPHLLAYSQHKNHYPAMNSMVKEIFKKDYIKRKRYPFLPWNFMLFEILHIKVNKS